MATLSEIFGWAASPSTAELPALFPMPIGETDFITTDVMTIYSKILTDVLERTHGMTDDQVALMWDNCVKSNASEGLVSLLSRAMSDKADLYLVYDSGIGVLRKATPDEQVKIADDYKKQAKSATGVFISFRQFRRSDMIRLYSAMGYSTISALNKNLNISAAVQLKFSDLRASTALTESDQAKTQAQAIATALLESRPIMMDAKDEVTTAEPDLTATEKSIQFISDKLAFYLGMPSSYITGEQTAGIGSTGENDMRAVERGLKNYWYSIVKPTVETIFGIKVKYKSQDVRNMDGALNVLKTFELTSEALISEESKLKIINQVFDLPEDAEGDEQKQALSAVVSVTPIAGAKPTASAGPAGADIQKQALNGAQVASMVQIVEAVAGGQLPRDSAVQMIMVSFQLEQADAEKILGSAGKGFTPKEPAPAKQPSFAPANA